MPEIPTQQNVLSGQSHVVARLFCLSRDRRKNPPTQTKDSQFQFSQFVKCNFFNLVATTPDAMVNSPLRSLTSNHNAKATDHQHMTGGSLSLGALLLDCCWIAVGWNNNAKTQTCCWHCHHVAFFCLSTSRHVCSKRPETCSMPS